MYMGRVVKLELKGTKMMYTQALPDKVAHAVAEYTPQQRIQLERFISVSMTAFVLSDLLTPGTGGLAQYGL